MKKFFILIILFVPIQVIAGESSTSYMRCHKGSVETGDTTGKVLYLCGEPFSSSNTGKHITGSSRTRIRTRTRTRIGSGGRTFRSRTKGRGTTGHDIRVKGEEIWHYDVGGGVIHVLTFSGGVVTKIVYFRK